MVDAVSCLVECNKHCKVQQLQVLHVINVILLVIVLAVHESLYIMTEISYYRIVVDLCLPL